MSKFTEELGKALEIISKLSDEEVNKKTSEQSKLSKELQSIFSRRDIQKVDIISDTLERMSKDELDILNKLTSEQMSALVALSMDIVTSVIYSLAIFLYYDSQRGVIFSKELEKLLK